MPTYQYACTNAECANRFELVQSFTDPAASECPVCGGPVRKVYGSVGVVFKGSGFYRTDSRDASTKAAKSDSSAKAESGKSESAKSDSSSTKSESASSSASSSGSSTSSSSSPAAAAS